MPTSNWHDYLIVISSFACLSGFFLLLKFNQEQTDEFEETERSLFLMTFTYWLVYCVCFCILKFNLPEWEILLMSLKITAAISFFLTFCCILILPLHRVSMSLRQVE